MKQGYHRGFSPAEKTELWDRWQRGESMRLKARMRRLPRAASRRRYLPPIPPPPGPRGAVTRSCSALQPQLSHRHGERRHRRCRGDAGTASPSSPAMSRATWPAAPARCSGGSGDDGSIRISRSGTRGRVMTAHSRVTTSPSIRTETEVRSTSLFRIPIWFRLLIGIHRWAKMDLGAERVLARAHYYDQTFIVEL